MPNYTVIDLPAASTLADTDHFELETAANLPRKSPLSLLRSWLVQNVATVTAVWTITAEWVFQKGDGNGTRLTLNKPAGSTAQFTGFKFQDNGTGKAFVLFDHTNDKFVIQGAGNNTWLEFRHQAGVALDGVIVLNVPQRLPSKTSAQLTAGYATTMGVGALAWNSTTGKVNYSDGAAWFELGAGGGGGGGTLSETPYVTGGTGVETITAGTVKFVFLEGKKIPVYNAARQVNFRAGYTVSGTSLTWKDDAGATRTDIPANKQFEVVYTS